MGVLALEWLCAALHGVTVCLWYRGVAYFEDYYWQPEYEQELVVCPGILCAYDVKGVVDLIDPGMIYLVNVALLACA